MSQITTFFTTDHRACDQLWADLEQAVDGGEPLPVWTAFDEAMRRHLGWEEEIIFPAFEQRMGPGGPTSVMRAEHTQMRGVLDAMQGCADAGSWEDLLDHGDTLLMLIQQHNMKEEGILYPMCDRFLTDEWPAIEARLK